MEYDDFFFVIVLIESFNFINCLWIIWNTKRFIQIFDWDIIISQYSKFSRSLLIKSESTDVKYMQIWNNFMNLLVLLNGTKQQEVDIRIIDYTHPMV